MTAELVARLAGSVGALGLGALLLAPGRYARLAGLAVWAVGMALFVPFLAPRGNVLILVVAAVVGLAVSVALALLFRRWPWALPLLALATVPVRIPVSVDGTSANLLLPLYAVVAGAALALAWGLWRDEPRTRELGPLTWPLAVLVGWLAVSALWTADVREGAIALFFFVLPFGVLALAIARLPWDERAPARLYGVLAAIALLAAGTGLWQWLTRDIFWNPRVIVGNAYAPFYRVNSIFWDPSIYGRFLVVAILATLTVVLFARPNGRRDVALGALVAVLWVGLVFSFSQSSFAALAAGVALAATLAWRWRAVGALALVAAVMIPVGFASPQLENVRDNVFGKSAAGLNRATSGRAKLIANGVAIAADHPVAGVGVGGFKEAYAERLGRSRPFKGAASHNTPVTVAAETGVVGLALFAWLVLAALILGLRGAVTDDGLARTVRIAAGVVFAAILVHSLFYNALFEDPTTWGALALAALATRAAEGGPA
jgi:putative inorganic carbon (hco3(-)) transporter